VRVADGKVVGHEYEYSEIGAGVASSPSSW
jgi:hypothetical protein